MFYSCFDIRRTSQQKEQLSVSFILYKDHSSGKTHPYLLFCQNFLWNTVILERVMVYMEALHASDVIKKNILDGWDLLTRPNMSNLKSINSIRIIVFLPNGR